MQVSVVIPLFNEADSLPELMAWIHRVMQSNNLSYEVICQPALKTMSQIPKSVD